MERKKHWETVYETKAPHEVSWTQETPVVSLDFIRSLRLPKTAKIIDVGGGDSNLVDHLLADGFENITVLDISAQALEKAKNRLGEKAHAVQWVVGDITQFEPEGTFDLWHDRAAFHFLATEEEISKYRRIAATCVTGFLVLGTFSEEGPKKCSGLEIRQYTPEGLHKVFAADFEKIRCLACDHVTPFGTVQNFLFCAFQKKP